MGPNNFDGDGFTGSGGDWGSTSASHSRRFAGAFSRYVYKVPNRIKGYAISVLGLRARSISQSQMLEYLDIVRLFQSLVLGTTH